MRKFLKFGLLISALWQQCKCEEDIDASSADTVDLMELENSLSSGDAKLKWGKKIIKSTVDAGKSVAKTTVDAGKTAVKATASAGKTAVKATASAGKTAVKATATAAKDTGNAIVSAAKDVGDSVVKYSDDVANEAEKVAGLPQTVSNYASGVATTIGNNLENFAVQDLRPFASMVMGFFSNDMAQLWKWIQQYLGTCEIALPWCDCSGDKSSVSFANGAIDLKCTMPPNPSFPGLSQPLTFSYNVARNAKGDDCDANLDFKTTGEMSLTPTLAFTANPTTDSTTLTISATVTAGLNSKLSADASCSKTWNWTFPEEPVTETVCADIVCVVFVLQGLAQATVEGSVKGFVDFSANATWDFGADVSIEKGVAQKPSVTQDSFQHSHNVVINATASASVTVAVGPYITIVLLPGVPVEVFPKVFVAELNMKAEGDVSYPTGYVPFVNSPHVDYTCASFALNMKLGAEVSGLKFTDMDLTTINTKVIVTALSDTLYNMGNMTLQRYETMGGALKLPSFVESLFGSFNNAVMKAVEVAVSSVTQLIPNWDVGSLLPHYATVFWNQYFFCKTLWTGSIDNKQCEGMDTLQCPAPADLGTPSFSLSIEEPLYNKTTANMTNTSTAPKAAEAAATVHGSMSLLGASSRLVRTRRHAVTVAADGATEQFGM